MSAVWSAVRAAVAYRRVEAVLQHVPRAARIAVACSGGVDSALAAWLMQRRGHRLTALFMKNWEDEDAPGVCTAAADLTAARTVCKQLDIPLAVVNLSHEYWEQIFSALLRGLAAGITPNPDTLCNREIKFGAFLQHARGLGADFIVTGHYARIVPDDGALALHKGADLRKDQSYFLYGLGAPALAQSAFPLGALHKRAVRRLARRLGMSNCDRPGSTGICFIGPRRFAEFMRRYLPDEPGPICDPAGRELGRHRGLALHTIGQRQGLGIGGVAGAADGPWYVAEKDHARNRLIVVQGHAHPDLLADRVCVRELHWIGAAPPSLPFSCTAKTRYRQPDVACRILAMHPDGGGTVQFEIPQRALTPGQAIVFYSGMQCLGGAVIVQANNKTSPTTKDS